MRHRLVERASRETQCSRRHRGAKDVEGAHGDLEPLAFRADAPRRWNAAVRKAQRAERMRRNHIDTLVHEEPRVTGLYEKGADALRCHCAVSSTLPGSSAREDAIE